MRIMRYIISKLTGRDFPDSTAAKEAAESSAELLEVKIQETRDATSSVLRQARDDVRKSRRVLQVAEQAVRSLQTEQRRR